MDTYSKLLALANVPHVHVVASDAGKLGRLKPATMLTLFHGTGEDDLRKFLLGVIDAKKTVQRYHNQGAERGLYVTPSIKTAFSFGSVVVQLKVPAKLLYPTLRWSFGAGRKLDVVKKMSSERFPDSFRPLVSLQLLEKIEPQAMLLGYVPRASIIAVYVHDKSGTYVKLNLEQAEMRFNAKPRINFSVDSSSKQILAEIARVESYTLEDLIDVLRGSIDKPDILRSTFKLPSRLVTRCTNYVLALK